MTTSQYQHLLDALEPGSNALPPQGLPQHIANAVGLSQAPQGSIGATLLGRGPGASVEIEPGNPGSRVSVRTAERMGLIQLDRNTGAWTDHQHQPQGATPQGEQQGATPQGEPQGFGGHEFAAWNQTIQPLEQPVYDTAVNRVLAVASSGNLQSDAALTRAVLELHTTSGMQPHEAHAVVQQGIETYTVIASKVSGLSKEQLQDLGTWARSRAPERLGHALRSLVVAQDPSTFRELVRHYRADRGL